MIRIYTPKYERIGDTDLPAGHKVSHHRLLAVSEFGFDAVSENDVHHINGVEWDNRPNNLELMPHGDHRAYHNRENAEEKRFHDPDVLRRLYHKKSMSLKEIGDSFGVHRRAIAYWMDKHNIDRRKMGSSNKRGYLYHNPDKLRSLYQDEGRTIEEIAKEHDIAPETVRKRMIEHGIERRDRGERPRDREDYHDESTLRRLYNGEGNTLTEMADHFGVNRSTIQYWLKKHGIERRGAHPRN